MRDTSFANPMSAARAARPGASLDGDKRSRVRCLRHLRAKGTT